MNRNCQKIAARTHAYMHAHTTTFAHACIRNGGVLPASGHKNKMSFP